MKTNHFFFLLAVLLFVSCKKKEDPKPASEIIKQWYAYKSNDADVIKVENGYLYIEKQAEAGEPTPSSVFAKKSLKGDFELRIKFSSVDMMGSSLASEGISFALSPKNGEGAIHAVLFNGMCYVHDTTSGVPSYAMTSAREGEFYVKRIGGNYKAWMRAGSDTAHIEKQDYITSDVLLTMSVIISDETSQKTSVHIDEVSIAGGGGGMKSDSFNEDTLEKFLNFFDWD